MLAEERRTGADWRLGFAGLEAEIGEGVELDVDGSVPAELDGTLYRVGPARHDVYGERYRHWFDGDGMVHALRLSGGRAEYRNRFVATDKKRAEDAARRRLYGAFGTPPAGGPIDRLRHVLPKSAANTNVVFHGGKLLALWEGGRPWRLDPVTLDTRGEDDMSGVLGPHQAISAHPKLDRGTGEMWNFGVDYGPRPHISLYRTTADGQTTRVARHPLPFGAMVHDFALSPTKAVVILAPIGLPRIPVGLMSGRKSFGESLRWQPRRGTLITTYDRRSGEVREYHTDPFMMFHTANAFDDGDDVVVDLSAYQDASVMRFFTEVMAGQSFRLPTPPRPERFTLGAAGSVSRHRLADTILELPRVAGRSLGQSHGRIYGVSGAEDDFFLSTPVAVDAESGKTWSAPMRPGQYAGEVVPVMKQGATSDDDVWLLTLVLDAPAGRSELWVLDGQGIEAGPLARIPLPHVVPFGFHGNWVRASALPAA
ncbi:MAG: carotenoid oxygenase family protein [Acidimicrobiia bacterium]|nr:carotenoid oxygenase family protein [Acidimicrobiia bacterium]